MNGNTKLTPRSSLLPPSLVFLSGAAALVYQTLWVKQLALIVGVDVYAVTTAVSAFFAGLAIGGGLFGHRADRSTRPLRLFAELEAGTGLLSFAITIVLAHTAPYFVSIESSSRPVAWVLLFVMIGLPAMLMGGTLPALVRAVAPVEKAIGRVSGNLYAANTAGAIAGALVVTFLLVSVLGVRGSAGAAATLNFVAAALALLADHRMKARVPVKVSGARFPQGVSLALGLYALAGGVALGYEVVWTQAIVQFLSTRAFAFTVVLATYLIGLFLGSLLWARFADRVRRPWMVFGCLIAAAGASALMLLASLGPWLPTTQRWLGGIVLNTTGSELAGMCARFALAAAIVVLPPTILLGAAFPVAVRLAGGAERIGRDLGALLALNTAGGVAGTLLTGFVLVPKFGLVHTLGILAVAAAVLGAIAIARGANFRKPAVAGAMTLVLVVVTGAALVPGDLLARLLTTSRGGTLVFYQETPSGTVAVLEQFANSGSFHRLYIQGVSNSGDTIPSLRYMRLQALLPLLIHRGEPRSALVVGLGTGITAGALLTYDGLDRRVVAELLPAVVSSASIFSGNYGVTSDPRVTLRLADGRRELLRSSDSYDLITLEPPPPSAAGVVNLYSRDFYTLARRRLNPDGLVAQWLPLATQNDEDSRSLVRSFVDVFPHTTLWTTEFYETLLIGSVEPIQLDATRIAERFERPGVTAALREVGIASPAALLATYLTDRGGLERFAEDSPATTDNFPRIEYATWVRQGEITRVLPRVLALRTDPVISNANESTTAAIATERRRLMDFYQAGLYAHVGERKLSADKMVKVAMEDRSNPYYSWFLAGTSEGKSGALARR
ncbi:MAG: fused MFS/spermidine synthase [Pyrinomonadaceae bacterium]|nr:fused MFS/spermidine synthase [Pyrinomonadaceae bacterium]